MASLKAAFGAALDHLPLDEAGANAVLIEAESAFQRHIDLFAALRPSGSGAAA